MRARLRLGGRLSPFNNATTRQEKVSFYDYDGMDRLTDALTDSGNVKATYTYDAQGRLYSKYEDLKFRVGWAGTYNLGEAKTIRDLEFCACVLSESRTGLGLGNPFRAKQRR